MLTIKQITENTEAVIRGLEKKHFKNAKETIEQVIALNDKRRSTQNQLDKNLAEVNSLSRTIGQLMKEGKKEEAETARARVAELKEGNKELDATMTQAATDMQNALYTIPNIPYDSVPEGVGAEDNVVDKMGGMETEKIRRRLRFACLILRRAPQGGAAFWAVAPETVEPSTAMLGVGDILDRLFAFPVTASIASVLYNSFNVDCPALPSIGDSPWYSWNFCTASTVVAP